MKSRYQTQSKPKTQNNKPVKQTIKSSLPPNLQTFKQKFL